MKHLFALGSVLATGCALWAATLPEQELSRRREAMVADQIAARGVKNERVLAAMRKVKRHLFVPPDQVPSAYDDRPLPIGEDQTISQPYIVAFMTELLDPQPEHKVLEIGTGSGYQAAVLAELVKEVYTIEILKPLADAAKERLSRLGYKNVHTLFGDGYKGWPEHAPFDGIIVTCAPEDIPKPLLDQLKVGGRMVIPVGNFPRQQLVLVRKTAKGIEKEEIAPVWFVPMTGEAQKK